MSWPDQLLSLSVGEKLPALAGLEVVLHPEALTLGVDPLVGVGTEAVHMAEGLRDTAVTHQVGDLVCGLRRGGPEIPLHVGIAQTGVRQALLGVDEVRELDAVADEEDRGVVTDDVEVALAGVEPQREAAHIAPAVRGALLAGHSGETSQHLGLLAGLEYRCLGVLGDILGDDVAHRRRRSPWRVLRAPGCARG